MTSIWTLVALHHCTASTPLCLWIPRNVHPTKFVSCWTQFIITVRVSYQSAFHKHHVKLSDSYESTRRHVAKSSFKCLGHVQVMRHVQLNREQILIVIRLLQKSLSHVALSCPHYYQHLIVCVCVTSPCIRPKVHKPLKNNARWFSVLRSLFHLKAWVIIYIQFKVLTCWYWRKCFSLCSLEICASLLRNSDNTLDNTFIKF